MPEYRRARNEEIRDKLKRMQREHAAHGIALSTVLRFNTMLRDGRSAWFWPTIAAALTAHHHWLIIRCESCGLVIDLDLRVKPRDPEASIRVALNDVQCPRCNGYGRPKILRLAPRSTPVNLRCTLEPIPTDNAETLVEWAKGNIQDEGN
jgi:hypothetical protein